MFDTYIPDAVRRKLLDPLGAHPVQQILSGLSSSKVFRCELARGSGSAEFACLKASPATETNLRRSLLVHEAIQSAKTNGILVLPEFLPTALPPINLVENGQLWHLVRWLPGKADYIQSPSHQRLQNAMTTLAKLHLAWQPPSSNSLDTIDAPRAEGSPAMADRIRMLQDLLNQAEFHQWQSLARNQREQQLVLRTMAQIERFGHAWLDELKSNSVIPTNVHCVLRDIWSDHILFTEDEVTGVIDLGAMRIDEPATDVARLIGSLEPNSKNNWMAGVEMYCELNPRVDTRRVILLDKVSCLLSAVQWLRWLVLERREFHTSHEDLMKRWEGFLCRLESNFWMGLLD